MVGHKCVQFQANGAKKPGGYRKFQEPDGMTNIDLRNVHSVEEDVKIEESPKKKAYGDLFWKTCTKVLIITTLLLFGSITLLTILSQSETENFKNYWPLSFSKEANTNSSNSSNLVSSHDDEFKICRNNKSLQSCCLMFGHSNNVTIIQNCSLMDELVDDINKDIIKFKDFIVKLKNKLFSSLRNFNTIGVEEDEKLNILNKGIDIEDSTSSPLSSDENFVTTDKTNILDKNLLANADNNSVVIKYENTRGKRSYEWYRREENDQQNLVDGFDKRRLYDNGEKYKDFEPLLYYEPNVLAEVFHQKEYQNSGRLTAPESNNIHASISNDDSFDNYETDNPIKRNNEDVYTDNLEIESSKKSDHNEEDINKDDSDNTLKINIGSQLSEKNKPQFGINSNDPQNVQGNLLDPSYFQKQCVPYTPQVGSAFPLLQPYVAYPYDPNSKFAQLLPMPKQSLNPFLISPQFANANYQTLPSMYSLNQPYYWNQNIQNPAGQYYLCNPVTAPITNQLTNIPGVEVRESSSTEEPAEEINDQARTLRRCPLGQVSCSRDNKCIAHTQICDSQVDCPDASDEMFCSCPERIKEDRLCDGYFDCPDGEDEAGCFGCSSNSVSCNNWTNEDEKGSCIPKEQRCDGISQCTSGKDEEDCSILLESYETPISLLQVSTAKGFIFRNYKGTWYPVCSDPDEWASEICDKETGKNDFPPRAYTVPVQSNYKGFYLKKRPEGGVKLVDYCFSGFAIYIECPAPNCGLRNLLEESYPYEDSDESMEDAISRFGRERTNDTDLLELSRVVGGNPSQPAAWPWVVSIYRNGLFHCGGVIINDNWVITAAHCVDRFSHYYYEVEAGILRRFSYSPMQQTRYVSHIVSHNAYDRANLKNDLAMMKLSRPLIYSRYVRPICLPSLLTTGINYLKEPFPGTLCTAVGWGATVEHGTDPDHLREVEIPVLDQCKHREDEEGHEICAGFFNGGRDACQGDSGGPFMCKNPNLPEQWYLAGIVSHGEGCARPNEPGVYTRVSLYLDWLYTHINNAVLPERRPLHKCPGYSCNVSNKCLPIKRRCDRIVDCLLGDDEQNCDKNLVNKLFRNALRHMILVDSVQKGTEEEDKSNKLDFETTSTVATEESTTSITTGESTMTTVPPDNIFSTAFKMENSPTPKQLNRNDFSYTIEENTSFASLSSISDDGQSISYDQTTPTTTVYSTSAKIAKEIYNKDADAIDVKSNDVFRQSGEENGNVTLSIDVGDNFKCMRMLQVIPLSKRCDKIADCEDVSDEENCSCADYMRHLHPEGLCDNLVDCYDLSDEQNCETPCKIDEFHCNSNNACIPLHKKCDGNNDCPHNEDEHYCFALTDGSAIVLDENLRPHLNTNGVVTFYYRGSWLPMCDDNETEMQSAVASEVCLTLGLSDYVRYFQVDIGNRPLNIVTNWENKEHSNIDEQYEKLVVDGEKVCKVLYVRCSNVTVRWYEQGMTNGYLAPWDGAIYVDGEYKCTGTLLNLNWVLTSYNCFPGISKLNLHYVTVLLGTNGGYLDIVGPHEKIEYVAKAIQVLYSDVFLLKLEQNVTYTRYIRPLHFTMQNDLYRFKERCYATGRNKENKLVSIPLTRAPNCTANSKCFKRTRPILGECENTEKHWSGTIICESGQGYYPSAVFYEENGLCGFQQITPFTSLSIFKKNIFGIIENMEVSTIYQKECEGFRCALGKCIESRRICDGIQDCRDGEDESELTCYTRNMYCHLTNNCACTKHQLTCNDGKCVPKSAFCNKINDCSDESDEPDICNCFEYLKMTNPEKVCDGVRNCHDRSDENPEICGCDVGKYLCAQSRHCISMEMVCDGYPDCPNKEDERDCMKLKTFTNNANFGEVIIRTAGVWHQGCFERNLPKQEVHEICQHLGYVDTNATYIKFTDSAQKIAQRPILDPFNVVWLNKSPDVKFKLAMRNGDKPFVSFVNSTDCYRLFIQC